MPDDSIERILSDIGALLVEVAGNEPGEAFLYAEVGLNWIGPSVFKELKDRVVYRDCSNELSDRILDLWNTTPAKKKWNALLMTVSGDQLDARFQYSEGWDKEEGQSDRRPRVLQAKYGDKPIDFSQVDWGPDK